MDLVTLAEICLPCQLRCYSAKQQALLVLRHHAITGRIHTVPQINFDDKPSTLIPQVLTHTVRLHPANWSYLFSPRIYFTSLPKVFTSI